MAIKDERITKRQGTHGHTARSLLHGSVGRASVTVGLPSCGGIGPFAFGQAQKCGFSEGMRLRQHVRWDTK